MAILKKYYDIYYYFFRYTWVYYLCEPTKLYTDGLR
mgnify:CR=1 FL=1